MLAFNQRNFQDLQEQNVKLQGLVTELTARLAMDNYDNHGTGSDSGVKSHGKGRTSKAAGRKGNSQKVQQT